MSSTTRNRTTATKNRSTAPTSARALRSVPEPSAQPAATTARTDAEDKLWAALRAYPNSTAAALSVAAKIGKSTAQKTLTAWAAEGSVTRTSGIADGGRRGADVWSIAEDDTSTATGAAPEASATTAAGVTAPTDSAAPAAGAPTPATDPDAPSATEKRRAGSKDRRTTNTAASKGDTGKGGVARNGGVAGTGGAATQHRAAGKKRAAGTGGDEAVTGAAAAGAEQAPQRLVPGALRGMVEDYLRDHPGDAFGPTAIANGLGGKSSGAVSNALDKLVADGVAVRTQDKPRRFALAEQE